MMTEVALLKLILFLGYILAPIATNKFILNSSKLYSIAHKICLTIVAIGLVFNLNSVTFIWLLFCISGAFVYLNNERLSVFTISGIAKGIPFVFSIISSLWFFSAANDLHLLGYDQAWSLYAALHGCFLGWIFVGCLAFLSTQKELGKFYLFACYLSFVLFLFVAFGIDGVAYLKQVGVVGFSLLVPIIIGIYVFSLKKENLSSLVFSWVSLGSIVLSMGVALLNEFWINFPKILIGLPTMVLIHGFLNAFIVLPFFVLAIMLEMRKVN